MGEAFVLAAVDDEGRVCVARGPWGGAPSFCALGGLTAWGGVALALDGEALHVVAVDDEGSVWSAALSLGDLDARDRLAPRWRRVEGARSAHRPAACVWGERLVVAVSDDEGALWLTDDARRAPLRPLGGDARCVGAPALALHRGRSLCWITGTDGEAYVLGRSEVAESSFCSIGALGTSPMGVALAGCAERLAALRVLDDGHMELFWSERGEQPEVRFEAFGGAAVTAQEPALALVGEGWVCAVAGTDGQLYLGDTGGSFAPLGLRTSLPPALASQGEGGARRSWVRPLILRPCDASERGEALRAACAQVDEHMVLAQARYHGWLHADTFAVEPARVLESDLACRDFFETDDEGGRDGFGAIEREVLRLLGEDRLTCTDVLLVLFARSDDAPMDERHPYLGAGGSFLDVGAGGGVVCMEWRCVEHDEPYPFQSTLVHELGHAFGLPHVDEWGFDMDTCGSIMSYNPRHHTRGLALRDPGCLLPEELEFLARHHLAFPNLTFDPALHNPTGRRLRVRREA